MASENHQTRSRWRRLACIRWQLFISSFIWSHLIRTFVCCWKNLLLWLSSWFFPFELLGSAEKPMAGPSSCKGKIMRWEKFEIIGGKHNCSYYLWFMGVFAFYFEFTNLSLRWPFKNWKELVIILKM